MRTHRDVEVPTPVRAAAVLVGLQGLASIVVAVMLLVRALGGGPLAGLGYSEVIIFLVIAAAFAAPGMLLWRGRRGARNGAVFMQLLLLGGVWYQFSPAEWVALDVLITLWSGAVLVLLFLAPSRTWAVGPADE